MVCLSISLTETVRNGQELSLAVSNDRCVTEWNGEIGLEETHNLILPCSKSSRGDQTD